VDSPRHRGNGLAGGIAFEEGWDFRVAAPSQLFEGAEGLDFRLSSLAVEQSEHQNPDPLKPKGLATRKSQRGYSALTWNSGII
jgi:hypothetical protein